MKKSNDTIGNQTPDLPACSAVPQPTAPPGAPFPTSVSKLTRLIIYPRADNVRLVKETAYVGDQKLMETSY
jgi:hypothetical protein